MSVTLEMGEHSPPHALISPLVVGVAPFALAPAFRRHRAVVHGGDVCPYRNPCCILACPSPCNQALASADFSYTKTLVCCIGEAHDCPHTRIGAQSWAKQSVSGYICGS